MYIKTVEKNWCENKFGPPSQRKQGPENKNAKNDQI